MENEQERAAYYEAHRGDDLDEWDEAAPAKPRRRLAAMVSVRLAPEELDAVRAAAAQRGTSLSAFLRMAALTEAALPGANERPGPAARFTHPAREDWGFVAVTPLSTPLGVAANAEKVGASTGVVAPAA